MPIAVIIDLSKSKMITWREKIDREIRTILDTTYKRFRKYCIAKPALTQGDSIELLVNNWKPVIYLFHKLLYEKLRFNTGFGTTTINLLREYADECDGPAFWNAREALEEIKKMKIQKIAANYKIEEKTPENAH